MVSTLNLKGNIERLTIPDLGPRSMIQTNEGRFKTSWPSEGFVGASSTYAPSNRADATTGDKQKDQKEETDRHGVNQRRAGSSYVSPEPEEIESDHNLSGLPWGGISMRYIVESGKTKEQSRESSRGTSVQESLARTGGSSR